MGLAIVVASGAILAVQIISLFLSAPSSVAGYPDSEVRLRCEISMLEQHIAESHHSLGILKSLSLERSASTGSFRDVSEY